MSAPSVRKSEKENWKISFGNQRFLSLQEAIDQLNTQAYERKAVFRIQIDLRLLERGIPTKSIRTITSVVKKGHTKKFKTINKALEFVAKKSETKTASLEIIYEHTQEIKIQPSQAVVEGRPERLSSAINAFKFLSALCTAFVAFMGGVLTLGDNTVSFETVCICQYPLSQKSFAVSSVILFGIAVVSSVLYVLFYIQKLEFPFERARYHAWARRGYVMGFIATVTFLFGAAMVLVFVLLPVVGYPEHHVFGCTWNFDA